MEIEGRVGNATPCSAHNYVDYKRISMNPGANRGHLAGGFPPLRKICSGLANKHEDEAGGDQDFGYGGWRLAAGGICWQSTTVSG